MFGLFPINISRVFSNIINLRFEDSSYPNPPYVNSTFSEKNEKFKEGKKKQKLIMDDLLPTQGMYWYLKGKNAFSKKDFKEAIAHYTKAIEIGEESRFFRKRGECYKQMKEYTMALRDSVTAIELDDKNIKAHLLCGKCLAEIGKSQDDVKSIETSITRFTKAYSLCSGQNKRYFEKELSKYIYRAKKLLWYKNYEISCNQKQRAIEQYKTLLNSQNQSEEYIQTEMQKFILVVGDPQAKLKLEIPIYMICKISLEIMENPVITEAGHCYEKVVLIEHLRKNGNIDPLTRKPINSKFYDDFNVKQSIEYFLKLNPWAFEFKQDEEYNNIEF